MSRCPLLPAVRAFLVAFLVAPAVAAADSDPKVYSPYAKAEHATRVFWGDTHVHSNYSPDSAGSGNRIITPDEAYRFARGETIVGNAGQPVALRRPLDFLVVADHSEAMGLFPLLEEKNATLLSTPNGRRWSAMLEEGLWGEVGMDFALESGGGKNLFGTREAKAGIARTMWDRVIENAERHHDPGVFTAFIGYEWSSAPRRANLHRIVIFRDGAERTRQVIPFSAVESSDPEDLWRYMADYESKTGGRVLAIPHNSNESAGRKFALVDYAGDPLTRDYAERRRRWEPLVEATQIKGDSEAVPYLSPDDAFADYGTWDDNAGSSMAPHEDWMYQFEYVRPALGNGLVVANALGVNPFEFGLIGSTDSHTGFATADDSDFWGKFSSNEPPLRTDLRGRWAGFDVRPGSETAKRFEAAGFGRDDDSVPERFQLWSLVASGYAAVWARENTREALFDAMMRKETYATTGPRMVVRFFGSWNFEDDDALAPDLAAVGYAKGTPMGGTLAKAARSRPVGRATSPSFLVAVARDPEGANLDRIQIVKQWVDGEGKRRERIFDVAVSDGREIEDDGRCRTPVGDTVDVEAASYRNSIGASTLSAVWRDPDFDPKRRAVYYVRVLEIPTPRWTTYDAARLGTELPPEAPRTTQERAYTSPIWYTP